MASVLIPMIDNRLLSCYMKPMKGYLLRFDLPFIFSMGGGCLITLSACLFSTVISSDMLSIIIFTGGKP